jgi:glycosyltransferase involved in cell wall biosynthesis
LKERALLSCSHWLWERRFASYDHWLSISEYARRWTKTWWGIDTEVLYPPVDTGFDPTCKSNLVLSVGRFATYSHSKRQIEMMSVFRDLKGSSLRDWCCCSAGGLTDRAEDRAYFEQVSGIAATCGARVVPNVPRSELRALFGRAKLFWHAAGYGADHEADPFQAEHFGISTVEAMAAGAVPIVYDQGGQSEIVEHGRSGYLWKTLHELADYTSRLAHDDGLREEMAAAARLRAARFSRQAFVNVLTRLVQ